MLTAGESKRQIGNCLQWNGLYFNAFLAQTIIPPLKSVRAAAEIEGILRGDRYPFREFRSLFGQLSNFASVLRARRAVMYGLAAPLRDGPARARRQPEDPIFVSSALRAALAAWQTILLSAPGVSCAAGLLEPTFHAAPTVPADSARALFVYTDAAKEGATVACLGGWLHGFFFSFPIPADLLGYPIPQLEFLAVIAAKLTFRRLVGSAPMMLLTDSETSFHVLDHDGARHEHMQYLHLVYLLDGGAFDGAAHTYGDANPFADFASRGRLNELHELAAQHGIQARELLVPDAFVEVLARFRDSFGPRPYSDDPRARRARAVLERNSLALAQKCAAANKAGHMGTLITRVPVRPRAGSSALVLSGASRRRHFPAPNGTPGCAHSYARPERAPAPTKPPRSRPALTTPFASKGDSDGTTFPQPERRRHLNYPATVPCTWDLPRAVRGRRPHPLRAAQARFPLPL